MRVLLILITLCLSTFCHAQNVGKITANAITAEEFQNCHIVQPKLLSPASPNDTMVVGDEVWLTVGEYEKTGIVLYSSKKDNLYRVVGIKSGWTEVSATRPVFSDDKTLLVTSGIFFGRPGVQVFKIGDDKPDLLFAYHLKDTVLETRCVTATSVFLKTSSSFVKVTFTKMNE